MSYRLHWLAGAALLAIAIAGLGASSAPKVAAGTFVWHDLVTGDVAAARTFYGGLFGWTFETGKGVEPNYTIIRQNGLPIGGIVVPREPTSAQWLSYVAVPDVDRTVEAIRQEGGRLLRGPLDVRKGLRAAAVADAQGAALGLVSRGPLAAMPDGVPDLNRWLWMDYIASNATTAVASYIRVFGFSAEITETRENVSYYRLRNGRPRAGLFETPWPRDTSLWLPYVRVADPDASAKRAEALGGRIVQPVSARLRNGSMAIILDPAGAPVALQKFPFDPGVQP